MGTEATVITNEKELEEYFSLAEKNITAAIDSHMTLSKEAIQPIVFKVPSSEEKLYITSAWMEVCLNFQADVYDILEKALERKLTADEKKKAEVKVYISKGSNIYEVIVSVFEFFTNMEVFKEIKEMSVGQILSFVVPIAVACAFGKAYMVHKKYNFAKQKLDKDAEREIELKKLENERLSEEQKNEVQHHAMELEKESKILDILDYVADTKYQSEAKTARAIGKIPDVKQVEINGTSFDSEALSEIAKRKPREKKEEEQIAVRGWFHADDIHYPTDGDLRNVNITGTNDNGEPVSYSEVPVSKDMLSPEIYKAINDGEKLYWIFNSVMKGSKMNSILITSITKENPDKKE
jgi:hypothetical protein